MAKEKKPTGSDKKKIREKKEKSSQKKLQLLESTQMWSPVKDVLDGIVLTKDGRYIQILEFAPINFLLRPIQEQYNIADVFGSSIRIFPRKFQIKILSRKANVEPHVAEIQEYMKTETNEQCRQMQSETIRFIRHNGSYGVSKRFFLSFAYEPPYGIRRPSWEEIRASLYQTAYQIQGRLEAEPCSNELLSPPGSTDYTLNILYDCMNRAEAEVKSFESKIEDVVCAYLMENRITEENMYIPCNDFLAPQYIDPSSSPKYIIVDGKYHAYGYIPKHAYPLRSYPGWLSLLINMGEGIDVDIFVEKQSTDKIRQSLTRTMNWTQADYRSKDETAADIEMLENKLAAGRYIRSGLSSDQEFMYFSVMLSIIASSAEELYKKIDWVQTQLLTNDLRLRMVNFKHVDAFRSSLPLCQPNEQIFRKGARNILSGDFGGAYPFTSYEINDRGGIMLGINLANFSPVFINSFDRTLYANGNMAIFGSTGSGKTYLLQCIALRMRQQQIQTIIIAPHKGHEYRRACQAVGGQYISLSPGSPHNINVMEIRKYDTTTREMLDGADSLKSSILNAKIEQLNIFFSMLMPDMSVEERHELGEALIRAYGRYGITSKNKSLIDPSDPTRYKQMPLLGDVYQELEKKHKETYRLRSVLSRFVTGSASSFNAPTNIDLSNPYIVIDVSNMTDDLLPLGIFIATEFVSDTVMADRTKKKTVIWDELHRLISRKNSEAAAEYVLSCWKLFRAYNAVCICATQDANDFFAIQEGAYGKRILSNSKFKILMKVEPTEATTLSSIVELSPMEAQRIQYFKRGEALLIANRNHAEVKITASPLEDAMITTDPAQLAQQIQYLKRQKEKM